MCDEAFNKCFLRFCCIPNFKKTHKMCGKIIAEDPFSLRYVPDQYKT